MTEETKQCPYCGSTIPINVKKCKFCGEWLVVQDKDKPKSSLHIGGIIEAIICVIIVICMFTINYSDSIIFAIVCLYIGLHFYFLPSLIADKKRTEYTAAIFAINLFLGATVIGWIGSLIWALTLPNLSKNIEHIDNSNKNINFSTVAKDKNITIQENNSNNVLQIESTNITNSTCNKETPNNIKQWNWGAFWLTWIWGIGNKSYKTLWALIPYFGFIWMFVCGTKGNEWAWQNKQWSSVEDYNNAQRKWAIVGNILTALLLILSLACYITAQKISNELVSKEHTIIQEEVYSNIEERGGDIDISEDDYNRFVRENQQKKQSPNQVQQNTQQKQQPVVQQKQQAIPVQTNVVVPQTKPVKTKQQNQDIDEFMN